MPRVMPGGLGDVVAVMVGSNGIKVVTVVAIASVGVTEACWVPDLLAAELSFVDWRLER